MWYFIYIHILYIYGDALLVEFATEVGPEKMEGKLIVPQRVATEVDGQTPLIVVYFGVKVSKSNKDFHNLVFIDVERAT